MCKGDSMKSAPKPTPILLTTLDSFSRDDGKVPSFKSFFVTCSTVLAILVGIEQALRYLFYSIQHYHPLLEIETNRFVLARHLGVDALSCAAVAVLGWRSRDVCKDLTSRVLKRTNSMPDAGHEKRLFSYDPAAFRIALVFFAFQFKNFLDTLAWGDGPEYVFHHVMSMTAAFASMYPGIGHFYVIFFLGVSEVSTAILSVLANFDDDHGVPGLGDAFPMAKASVGVCFVISFFICRCFMWPIAGYYCSNDCTLALKGDSPQAKKYGLVIRAIKTCLISLSLLQVVFLVQLVIIARQELKGLGFI